MQEGSPKDLPRLALVNSELKWARQLTNNSICPEPHSLAWSEAFFYTSAQYRRMGASCAQQLSRLQVLALLLLMLLFLLWLEPKWLTVAVALAVVGLLRLLLLVIRVGICCCCCDCCCCCHCCCCCCRCCCCCCCHFIELSRQMF